MQNKIHKKMEEDYFFCRSSSLLLLLLLSKYKVFALKLLCHFTIMFFVLVVENLIEARKKTRRNFKHSRVFKINENRTWLVFFHRVSYIMRTVDWFAVVAIVLRSRRYAAPENKAKCEKKRNRNNHQFGSLCIFHFLEALR